jgi:hypothetical protein
MNKIEYKKVPLTDEEVEDATLQVALLESRMESSKLNMKHLKLDEENKYSERLSVLNARQSLEELKRKIEMEEKTNSLNLKMYKERLKTKMKEVPIEEEKE